MINAIQERLAMKSQVEKIDKKILNKLKLGSG